MILVFLSKLCAIQGLKRVIPLTRICNPMPFFVNNYCHTFEVFIKAYFVILPVWTLIVHVNFDYVAKDLQH